MSHEVEAEREASTADLYGRDFYSWTRQQADILRAGRMEALDVANILEEIETLGRAERSSLKSAYRLVCSHLLKMTYQASKATRSWFNSVDRERGEVVEILEENPGLRPRRIETFAKAYKLARRDAARETRLPVETFPEEPPFTLEECESMTFVPPKARKRLEAGAPSSGKGRRSTD